MIVKISLSELADDVNFKNEKYVLKSLVTLLCEAEILQNGQE